MGHKKVPGLKKRDGIWHIDKRICGRRICRSTQTTCLEEAQRYLARVMEETRHASHYGIRPERLFNQAAARFVMEHQHKRSLRDDVRMLRDLMPWIGDMPIEKVHMGTLQPWLDYRQRQGRAAATINQSLQIVRRILNLASGEWMDEHGLTWLERPPRIRLLPNKSAKPPYPLSWEEQDRLFAELPDHLRQMALFAVNTGCRDSEVCSLRWDWQVPVAPLNTSVFLVPADLVKNGDERLVVLNHTAKAVIEAERGKSPTHVFTYRGSRVLRIMNSAWLRARQKVGLDHVRVHDLKHTFGRRLRAAGVSFEDRQDLLGHRSGRITTHYSAAELTKLIEAANSVCESNGKLQELVVLKGRFTRDHAKFTQSPKIKFEINKGRRVTH